MTMHSNERHARPWALAALAAGLWACDAEEPEPAGPMEPWVLVDEDGGLDSPESAHYHAASDSLFVSNQVGDPLDPTPDGRGYITRVSLETGDVELRWLEGLDSPRGMRIHDQILWVADTDELLAVDIQTAQIVSRHPAPGTSTLNDVAVVPDGRVFVSDPFANTIHRLDGDQLEVFAQGEHLDVPNGLLVDGDRLVVASVGVFGDPNRLGSVYALDLDTADKTLVTQMPLGRLDGVERAEGGDYIVSDFAAGLLYRVDPQGMAEVVSDALPGVADIGIDPATGAVFAPLTSGGTVLQLSL